MNQKQKTTFSFIAVLSLSLAFAPVANAMHIMEGYLPLAFCIAWGVLCLPFLTMGFFSIKKTIANHRKTLILLAMIGAFSFVLSSLKIPSVSGSSSHPTGTGLGAILFGPSAMSIIGLLVLIFQALLLAHGGLTTLGANTFSMAIAGPFLSYFLYWICQKTKVKKPVAIFLACAIGNLFTYCITSFQLALAHPASANIEGFWTSLIRFLSIFAITQVPLAVIEGLLSVAVMLALESYATTELAELNSIKRRTH